MPYKIRGDVEVERDLLVNRNVGVNTSAPTEKLEVLGTAKVSELIVSGQGQSYKLPTSAGIAGQVLASRENNNTLVWENATLGAFTVSSYSETTSSQTVINSYDNTQITFKRIKGGGIIDVSEGTNEITISAATRNITFSAYGAGANLFLGVSGGTEIRHRTIIGSNIEVSAGANEIIISALTQNVTLSSLGGGTSLAVGVSGNREVQIRSLTAGGRIDITTSSNTINISARSGVFSFNMSAGANLNATGGPITSPTGTIDVSLTSFPRFVNISANNLYSDSILTTRQIGIDRAPAAGISIDISATGAIRLPAGTTAQRPSSPAAGMIRYNTSNYFLEGYSGPGPEWNPIGQWIYLGQYNLAGTTTNITSLSAGDDFREYEEIRFDIFGLGNTTNASNFLMNFYINGTVNTASEYNFVRYAVIGGATTTDATGQQQLPNSVAQITLIPATSGLPSNSARGFFGQISVYNYRRNIFNSDNTKIYAQALLWGLNSDNNYISYFTQAKLSAAANSVVTGIRFTTGGGNFFGGVRIFGKRGY